MKRMTCEMCGSTDLVKKEGLFECQSCGTKYSVEEAKKMLIEGTVQVEGTVKVDDSNKVDNLIKNAKTLFKDDKYNEAYKLFGDVLNIDTENYIAITYRGLCSAWSTTVASPKISDAVNGISRGFEIAQKQLGETKEYAAFCMDVVKEMSSISNACMNLYKKHYLTSHETYIEWMQDASASISRSGHYADINWWQKRQKEQEAKYEKAKTIAIEGMHLTLVASNVVSIKVLTHKDITIYSEKDYKKIKEFILGYLVVPNDFLNRELDDFKLSLGMILDIDDRIKKLKKLEREEYFKKHPEKKEELEKKISSSKKKITKLTNEINENSELINSIENEILTSLSSFDNKVKKIQSEINDLNAEKSSLGLFKIKDKKALQTQIDAKTNDINDLVHQKNVAYTEKKSEKKVDIDKANSIISDNTKEISELKEVIKKAEIELYGDEE